MILSPDDELLIQRAIENARAHGYYSISLAQIELQVGYSKAVMVVEEMERREIIGAPGADYRRPFLTGGSDGPGK